MAEQTFHFYSDPGHGWLAVKRKLLKELGIEQNITPYSYERGETVYLEEDLDMSSFLASMRAAHRPFKIVDHSVDRRSQIRGYSSYRKEKA